MTVSFSITWDGDVPGIAEHSMSLDAWLPALRDLQRAVRRTASGLASEAHDDPAYGARGGRHTRMAAGMDLRVVSLRAGSLALDLELFAPPPDDIEDQGRMFQDHLPLRTLERVLDCIEREAAGEPCSATVKSFLSSLPEGLTSHQYQVEQDGEVIRLVQLGQVNLQDDEKVELPFLEVIIGSVVAVGFRPGRPHVTLHDGNRQTRAWAGTRLVEAALGLREGRVRATVVNGMPGGVRLVRLDALSEVREESEPGERSRSFGAKWAKTLEILS